MNRSCPNPNCAVPDFIVRDGTFRRKEDAKIIQRFRCQNCRRRFSHATFSDAYRQKKRRVNAPLLNLLSSNVSMRRSAKLLGISRLTVERKLIYLAHRCRKLNDKQLSRFIGKIQDAQLDDLITKENSKLKPLSVTIVADEERRVILASEVSQIPAFGHLAKIAVKKYGYRRDEHDEGLRRTFERLKKFAAPELLIKTDEHQRYPSYVSAYFPRGKHLTFKSERACVAGQGELKKVRFDPLFLINHTCAMLRANVNRLVRKTWCTTKSPQRLKDHLDIFVYFYNKELIGRALSPL